MSLTEGEPPSNPRTVKMWGGSAWQALQVVWRHTLNDLLVGNSPRWQHEKRSLELETVASIAGLMSPDELNALCRQLIGREGAAAPDAQTRKELLAYILIRCPITPMTRARLVDLLPHLGDYAFLIVVQFLSDRGHADLVNESIMRIVSYKEDEDMTIVMLRQEVGSRVNQKHIERVFETNRHLLSRAQSIAMMGLMASIGSDDLPLADEDAFYDELEYTTDAPGLFFLTLVSHVFFLCDNMSRTMWFALVDYLRYSESYDSEGVKIVLQAMFFSSHISVYSAHFTMPPPGIVLDIALYAAPGESVILAMELCTRLSDISMYIPLLHEEAISGNARAMALIGML
jgi:hypothetical protein